MTYQRSIHIDAPVTGVFNFFRDPSNWARQQPAGVQFTDIRLTPEGVGTHYSWKAKVAGVPVVGLNLFTEFVPDQRITDRSSNPLEGTWTYSFEHDGSGTRLSVENKVGNLRHLPPLERLLGRMTAKTHDPLFARVKAMLER